MCVGKSVVDRQNWGTLEEQKGLKLVEPASTYEKSNEYSEKACGL